MTPPNVISLCRLISVPVIVWLMLEQDYQWALWLFIGAGVSDGVDGFLAKRFNWRSRLGSFLDPLADKALLVSIYVTLGMQHHLPSWLVLLVVSRDILIVGAVLLTFFLGHEPRMQPLLISKINTLAQIALAALMLAALGYALPVGGMLHLATILVGLTTVASGARYVATWIPAVAAWEEHHARPGNPDRR